MLANLPSSTIPIRKFFNAFIERYFSDIYNNLSFHTTSQLFTVVIEKYPEPYYQLNQMFEAAKAYLGATARLCGEFQASEQENLEITVLEIHDSYKDVQLRWRFVCRKYKQVADGNTDMESEKMSYELTFLKKHIDTVLNSYLAYILEQEKAIREANVQKLFSSDISFDTLVIDSENKKAVLDDLNNFMNAKEFCRRIGKAWNRRYLLYGPPGTGKSRLISAMANYMNYSIYELDCTHFHYPATFVQSLPPQSILVIKNTECNTNDDEKQLMVTDLIKMTGGLWSCCGSECIFIFVTNRVESVNPALMMPSRIDMTIDMSRCNTPSIESSESFEVNTLHQPNEAKNSLFLCQSQRDT